MANNARGEIKLELDRPRTWVLRWKDIAEIENALTQLNGTKVNWMAFRSKIQEWSAHDYAVVLWAGLRHEDPSITPEAVMEMADFTVQDEFMIKLSECIAEAIPDSIKKKYQMTGPIAGSGQ